MQVRDHLIIEASKERNARSRFRGGRQCPCDTGNKSPQPGYPVRSFLDDDRLSRFPSVQLSQFARSLRSIHCHSLQSPSRVLQAALAFTKKNHNSLAPRVTSNAPASNRPPLPAPTWRFGDVAFAPSARLLGARGPRSTTTDGGGYVTSDAAALVNKETSLPRSVGLAAASVSSVLRGSYCCRSTVNSLCPLH